MQPPRTKNRPDGISTEIGVNSFNTSTIVDSFSPQNVIAAPLSWRKRTVTKSFMHVVRARATCWLKEIMMSGLLEEMKEVDQRAPLLKGIESFSNCKDRLVQN